MNARYIVCGIIQRGDEIALGKKAEGIPPYPDVWHTPGGGADNLELARELCKKNDFENIYFKNELKREMREELGVEITNIQNIIPKYRPVLRQSETPNKNGEMTHYYFLEYLCDYVSGNLQPSDDLVEAIWIKKSELKNFSLTPPSQEMYRELNWL